MPESAKADTQLSRQEMLGITLIIGFNAVIMLSIINDEQAYLPPTTKNKEKFLRESIRSEQRLCKDCQQLEQSMQSEANKYDERLSQKYGQRILRAGLDPRGSIEQFNGGASPSEARHSSGKRSQNASTGGLLLQDEEHERLLPA